MNFNIFFKKRQKKIMKTYNIKNSLGILAFALWK